MLIIDASLGVWLVLPQFAPRDPAPALEAARLRGEAIAAPMHWRAEVVSIIAGYAFAGQLTDPEGAAAAEELTQVDLDLVPLDTDLCLRAFAWARRLHQRRAYDAFYVALAERRGARLWTGDQRLYNACRALRLDWVDWLGPGSSLLN